MIGSETIRPGDPLAPYTPKEQDEYLRELAESLKKGVQP